MILVCLSMSYFLKAQEAVKQKEIGLVFSNLNNFGLSFKIGTDNSLWRFNTLLISGNSLKETSDSTSDKQGNIGFGVRMGKELRKDIADNLQLKFGADLSFAFSHYKNEKERNSLYSYNNEVEQTTYRPGVNLVFGVQYKLSNNFYIGAELLPGFTYTSGNSISIAYNSNTNEAQEVKKDISGYNYGLSNTSVLLSLAYAF